MARSGRKTRTVRKDFIPARANEDTTRKKSSQFAPLRRYAPKQPWPGKVEENDDASNAASGCGPQGARFVR